MRMLFFLILSLLGHFSFGQTREDLILQGGTFSYSHSAGVKPFLNVSPGLHDKSGIGVGLGVGYTSIPKIDATTIPLFVRFSYLPLDAPVSPAFQFHLGYALINKETNGITYKGGLYLHVAGGVGFNIKKNRGLILQAGYSRINVNQIDIAGISDGKPVKHDGWMALFGFKF